MILAISVRLLSLFTCYSLNERILKPEKHTWLNLIGTIPNDKDYSKWSPQDLSTWLMDRMRYLYVTRRTSVHHLYTFWVVANLNDAEGRQLLREALEYIVSDFSRLFMHRVVQ